MEKNLTQGRIFKNLVLFSLPFLLSYFLQTLYGLADLFIVGQFCGVENITAVSVGSQIMHMLTVMIVGLAMGSSVSIGKAVGAEDKNLRNLIIGNTVIIFICVSFILAILLLILNSSIIKLISVPQEAIGGTYKYLAVCFAGIPFIVAYNIISSILRGMGDSKTPMYFIAIACVCNIILDFVFVGFLKLEALGAALGTIISQGISVIISLVFLVKKKIIDGFNKSHFKIKKNIVSAIFKIGIPVSAQDGFIQISFIIITVFANKRGLNDAAAVGIVEKIIGILFLIPSTLLSSVSTLCAQNIGAGKEDRAKKTLFCSCLIAIICGLFFAVLFQFIASFAVSLFTKNSEVIKLGSQYLKSYVWDCVGGGIHFSFSGYFCACSRSGISFLHNVISILTARIPLAYYASVHFKDTLFPMGFAAPTGSFVSVIVCIIAFLILNRKSKISVE